MKKEFDIYLASASPRRRELLSQIGITTQLVEVDVPEILENGENARQFVTRLALAKARAGLATLGKTDVHPVLGADTAVVAEGQILGKPTHAEHAKTMLSKLSDQKHQVMSAVAVVSQEHEVVKVSVSEVTFRHLEQQEIQAYWDSGECQDKAGAYAIQGLAAVFIENLQGSYSGVMGLPLFETAEILQGFGIIPIK